MRDTLSLAARRLALACAAIAGGAVPALALRCLFGQQGMHGVGDLLPPPVGNGDGEYHAVIPCRGLPRFLDGRDQRGRKEL